MNEERELAKKIGCESPVHETIEGTHRCYNDNIEAIITNMKQNDALFVGSHNVDSVEKAVDLATRHGMLSEKSVMFGQLQGFSDQVTGDLANRGIPVFKYVPFGPTEQVMPYLVRRG